MRETNSNIGNGVTTAKTQEISGEQNIIVGSTSHRRRNFIEHAALGRRVIPRDGGDENPEETDVKKIALEKLNNVDKHLTQEELQETPLRIAADALTEIAVFSNGGIRYESRRKPEDKAGETWVDEIQNNFRKMAEVANEMGFGHYRLLAGSVARREGIEISDCMQCTVILDKDKLEYLATTEGVEAYLAAFQKHYTGDHYQGAGKVEPTNLCGGISLPVLIGMGAVTQIDGVKLSLETDEQKQNSYSAIYDGLYTVGVGFSPRLFMLIGPQVLEQAMNWPWLHANVKAVMEEYEKNQRG